MKTTYRIFSVRDICPGPPTFPLPSMVVIPYPIHLIFTFHMGSSNFELSTANRPKNALQILNRKETVARSDHPICLPYKKSSKRRKWQKKLNYFRMTNRKPLLINSCPNFFRTVLFSSYRAKPQSTHK